MSRHHKRTVENQNKVEKRHRQSEKRRLHNRSIRSRVRTFVSKVRRPMHAGDTESAQAGLRAAISELDKAASKGVIHKNNAARHKSRLMKQLAQAEKQSA